MKGILIIIKRIGRTMAVIEKHGLKHHSNFCLLFPTIRSITLFGHVFYNMDYDDMVKYLDSSLGEINSNHERIHVMQANSFKLGYFSFYCRYLAEWIRNLIIFGFTHDAYRNISFEREAHENDENFDYNETHWRDYKYKL